METECLEGLIDIATESESYEEIDFNKLYSLCSELGGKTSSGTRFKFKKGLIQKLVGISFKNETTGSFKTIVENFVYFTKDLKIGDVGKFVSSFPHVFDYDIKENLKPKVEYLRSIGVKDIGKFVGAYPPVLGHNIEENMKPKVEYLRSIGVKDIGKFVSSSPSVFKYNIEENMKPKVEYLKEIGVRNVGKFVSLYPSMVGRSIEESMKPKLEFYKSRGYNIEDIEKLPAAIGYSMKKRIEPRFAYLEHLGIRGVSLNAILIPKDSTFSKRFGGNEHSYSNFLKEEYVCA